MRSIFLRGKSQPFLEIESRFWPVNTNEMGIRYSLALATSVMLWMVLKKKPSSISQRVTRNREW